MSSERLAVKLIEYARLHQYEAQPAGRRRRTAAEPGWMPWYPVFPRLLFILTAAPRTRLEGRISDLQAMTAQHPLVTALAREVPPGSRHPRRPRTPRPHPERMDTSDLLPGPVSSHGDLSHLRRAPASSVTAKRVRGGGPGTGWGPYGNGE